MMGRFLVLVALSLMLQTMQLVLGDGPDNNSSINLDDDTLTPQEILFSFKYIGLDPAMATTFTDMIMTDGDTNADGVIEFTEMKTWV